MDMGSGTLAAAAGPCGSTPLPTTGSSPPLAGQNDTAYLAVSTHVEQHSKTLDAMAKTIAQLQSRLDSADDEHEAMLRKVLKMDAAQAEAVNAHNKLLERVRSLEGTAAASSGMQAQFALLEQHIKALQLSSTAPTSPAPTTPTDDATAITLEKVVTRIAGIKEAVKQVQAKHTDLEKLFVDKAKEVDLVNDAYEKVKEQISAQPPADPPTTPGPMDSPVDAKVTALREEVTGKIEVLEKTVAAQGSSVETLNLAVGSLSNSVHRWENDEEVRRQNAFLEAEDER
jgi:uncharacterized protein YoxC